MDQAQQYLKLLRAKLDKIPLLQGLENKTNIPKEMLVLAGGLILAVLVLFGVGMSSLASMVGFLYPAFKSFQVLEMKTKGDDTQWLVYWVIFAFFSILETFSSFLLYWIPFYYAFKLAFLLWAMLPQTKGAKYLYDSFLKDFLKKNESRIDAAMADAKKQAGAMAAEFAATAEATTTTEFGGAVLVGGGGKKDT